jgi:hypothetical protein
MLQVAPEPGACGVIDVGLAMSSASRRRAKK